MITYAKHLACELAFLSHTVTWNDPPASSVGLGDIISKQGKSGLTDEQPEDFGKMLWVHQDKEQPVTCTRPVHAHGIVTTGPVGTQTALQWKDC